jgi:FtsP/CotA-like multicopper oxidase with cupredoxin domain
VSFDRRAFLRGAAALAGAPLVPLAAARANAPKPFALDARVARVPLVGTPHPDTDVWAYDGRVPGPELRLKQGERLRVAVTNRLPEGTTVHWHGVRVPNAMDGVAHLTQPPIAANGGTFVYEFEAKDAGTYWYHPHSRSYEQVGRGLSGALVVEERAPIAVDRDLTWMLADWRLTPEAQHRTDFGSMFDVTHAGRIGNTVTVNGVVPESLDVRAGERVRLRLVNAANARVFALEFRGHRPWIVALDGQPVEPHEPEGGRVLLGPSMRADLVLDLTGKPGERHAVHDTYYPRASYRLLDLAYSAEPPLKSGARGAPMRLPPNPLPEPDLARAVRHRVAMTGGMMGGMQGGMMGGGMTDMREMMRQGMAWAMNGVVGSDHSHPLLFAVKRDASCVVELVNDTAWDHPMHLHGHAFRVLTLNGKPTRRREWRDTVLLRPREIAEIAFVADNPGDWMFHCHVLEHQAGGMMAVVRVG